MSKKRNASVSRSFLITTNPEIFSIKPRSGGYATIMEPASPSKKSDEEESKDNVIADISREFRIQRTVLDSAWTLTSTECSEDAVELPTPFQDAMDMLAVSLTTVMLLAAGSVGEITNEQYKWSKQYLSCIKDDYGHSPPNIQMILNHIESVHPPEEDKDDNGGNNEEGNDSPTKRRPQTLRTFTKVTRNKHEEAES